MGKRIGGSPLFLKGSVHAGVILLALPLLADVHRNGYIPEYAIPLAPVTILALRYLELVVL